MKSIAAAALLTLAAAGPAAAQMVKVEGLKPVSAHVQVIPDNSVGAVPNVGYIVGSKAVLVVDTGLGAANGAAVYEVAGRLAGSKQIYLVATHAHPEHDLGAQAFPAGTKLIRSADQAAEKDADLNLAKVFAARTPAMAELLKDATFRPADETFTTEKTLDLGGISARIIALGPNHTGGDTAVWVAADKVLFSGDVAMRAQPAMVSQKTSIAQWMKSLALFDGLKPAVVVPSHGPVGDAGYIAGYRAYLAEVADRVAKAKAAGQTAEAATAAIQEAMSAKYPDKGRLAGAIRVAWGASYTNRR